MKSIMQITAEADEFRRQIQNLRNFLAETIEPYHGATVGMKEFTKRAQLWHAEKGTLPDTKMHPLRKWLEAWKYDIQPDRKTWEPLIIGFRLK